MITITGTPSASTSTDPNGKYTFTALVGQIYSVQAGKAGYAINSTNGNPQSTFPIIKDTTLPDFIATPNTYTISGTVFDYNGTSPLQNVTVTCIGAPESTITTGTNGIYSFSVNVENNYTIIATRPGYAFNPTNRQYINPSQDYTAQNFTAFGSLGPVLISPPNSSVGVSLTPNFTWNPPTIGSTPTGYLIQISTSTSFASFVGGSNIIIPHSTSGGQSWTATSNLSNGTTF